MIRHMIIDDIPRLLDLGERFYCEAGLDLYVPFNRESMKCYLEAVITSDDAVVFVSEQSGEVSGAIGGTVSPYLYNFDYKMLLENFWYFDVNSRNSIDAIKLTKRLREWAKEKGAELCAFGAFNHMQLDKLTKIYSKLGLQPHESLFFGRV